MSPRVSPNPDNPWRKPSTVYWPIRLNTFEGDWIPRVSSAASIADWAKSLADFWTSPMDDRKPDPRPSPTFSPISTPSVSFDAPLDDLVIRCLAADARFLNPSSASSPKFVSKSVMACLASSADCTIVWAICAACCGSSADLAPLSCSLKLKPSCLTCAL